MKNVHRINQNIYITSDEEIKVGDWCLDWMNLIWIANDYYVNVQKTGAKKIILTTDQDLINPAIAFLDDVQAIDDKFLEWFVKNPSCEEVKIESWQTKGEWDLDYKIIIPQEEPNRTHYLDELPNIDKEILAKMWKDAVPKLEPKQEWTPTQGETVWIKVFSNWSKGTYIGYDVVKQTHLVREDEEGGGYLMSSSEILPYYSMPNKPKQENSLYAPKIFSALLKKYNELADNAFTETLEEAAEKEFLLIDTEWCRTGEAEEENLQLLGHRKSFIKGAKWQAERMYSEEDIRNAFDRGYTKGWTEGFNSGKIEGD